MKSTHKLKNAIAMLKEFEKEKDSECKNNYFTINKSKYYVVKNGLYKNQDFERSVGTIKNGVIIFNSPLFKSRKRHRQSKTPRLEKSFGNYNTIKLNKNSLFPSKNKTTMNKKSFKTPEESSFEKPESSFEKPESSFEKPEVNSFEKPEVNSFEKPESSFEKPESSFEKPVVNAETFEETIPDEHKEDSL